MGSIYEKIFGELHLHFINAISGDSLFPHKFDKAQVYKNNETVYCKKTVLAAIQKESIII